MHPLLRRHLKRCAIEDADTPPDPACWRRFLERVEAAYGQADEDRYLLERSLSISSREMRELNESLRRSESDLAVERDRLAATIASLGEGLCMLDRAGRVTFVNPEGCRMLGRDEQELRGLTVEEAFGPVAGDWGAGDPARDEEGAFLHGDGSEVPVSYILSSIEHGEAVLGTVLSFRDISEIKRARETLEREHRQLQVVIRNAPIAMAMLDEGMRYLAFSQLWLTDWGLEDRDILGRSHLDVFPDVPEDWRGIYERTLRGERYSGSEDTVDMGDGETLHLRWATHPWMTLEGRVGGMIIVSQRIDDLVRARESALEMSRAKAQFLANMSHEIRTPMNGVIGMTELLLGSGLDERQLEFTETIHGSANSLLEVINDILDFSKIEAGRIELEELDFAPRALAQSVVDMLAEQARRRSLEIACLSHHDVPLTLCGDPARLRQILVNLVGNAVKFTEAGSVTLSVSVDECAPETSTLRFEVEDTGIGIGREAQEQLFEAFTQADGSTARHYGGTGLGLAISKQLVELMGGRIGLCSEPGRGSSFWFTVPLRPSTPAREEPLACDSTSVPLPQSSIRFRLQVLLAEDNVVNRKVAVLMLEKLGCLVDVAEEGSEAVDAVRERDYDLILMDCQMPGLDGFEATRRIRRMERDGKRRTRILALTAHAMPGDRERCLAAGMDDYLTKPLKMEDLAAFLKQWRRTG